MDTMNSPQGRRTRRDRETGLRRIERMTRWSLAGALAGTGLFAGTAAQGGVATVSSPTTANGSAAAAAVTSGAS